MFLPRNLNFLNGVVLEEIDISSESESQIVAIVRARDGKSMLINDCYRGLLIGNISTSEDDYTSFFIGNISLCYHDVMGICEIKREE